MLTMKNTYIYHIMKTGLSEDIAKDIADEYEKDHSNYHWENCNYFLKHWCDRKISEYISQEGNPTTNEKLIEGCNYVGLCPRYSVHFVDTGIIKELLSVRNHILLQFIRTAYNGSMSNDIKSIE